MSANPAAHLWILDRLQCPDCAGAIRLEADLVQCGACDWEAALSPRPWDLRPRAPRPAVPIVARTFDPGPDLASLELGKPAQRVRPPAAARDSSELFSALLEHRGGGGDLLDLGCGPRDQADTAAELGFRYLGVDIGGDRADALADAHALPFADASFDVVFAYAVLEHLHNPWVALSEARRVLRQGGALIGTVSQGEPFHHSYLHHTLWGLLALARATGFEAIRIWPSRDTLEALAVMGHYSRPLRWSLRALARLERWTPFLTPRRWLTWTERERRLDDCARAGSLCFLLRPAAPPSSGAA